MSYVEDQATQLANKQYIRNTMSTPLLERDHELDLARRWKEGNDEKALHELIEAHGRLVVAIAMKFRHYGLPVADLIQEGNIGLMEASSRFEPEMGNRFSTYATWWIRAQIQDYILRNWSIVRTGTTSAQKSLFFNLRRLRAKIKGQASRDWLNDDSVQDIADELSVKPDQVRKMEARMNGGDQSLNVMIGEDGTYEIQDMMADSRPNPEDVVIGMRDSATRSAWLNEALSELSPREQTIIKTRQMNDNVVTLDTLGKQLGISKERVRQLEKRALDKLKESVTHKVREVGLEKDMIFMK